MAMLVDKIVDFETMLNDDIEDVRDVHQPRRSLDNAGLQREYEMEFSK